MKKSLRIALAMVALLAGVGTVRAQDNLDYYWFQNSGNWNDLNKWQVFQPATETTPAGYVIPTELPDATNAVFINGTTTPGGTPLSISQNAPATVTIEVGTVGTGPLQDFPFAAKSITFGGTIPAATTVNFRVNEPLQIGTATAPGAVTANYSVVITANNRLLLNGSLTFNAAAAGAALIVSEPTTIAGVVTVNAAATITANNTLTMGTLSFAAPVPGTQPQLNVNRPTTVNGAVTVNSPTTIITANTFTANSLAFNNGAGASTFTVNQQPATVTGTLTVGSGATITANRKLMAGTLSVSAAANIIANDTIQVTNAVNVSAPATITVNRNFSAGSLSFTSTAGASTFTVGRSTAPAITGASATISGAVSIGSAAIITTHPSNSLSIGGNLSFANLNTGARFNVNGTVTLGGSLSTAGPNNISSTNNAANLPTGSLTFTSAAVTTTIRSSGTVYNVPVTFNSASSGIPGQWLLEDNLTIGFRVTFVNGYVEAPTYNSDPAQLANSRMLILNDRSADGAIIGPVGANPNSHVIGFVRKQSLRPSDPMIMPVGAGIVNGIKLYRPVIATAASINNATVRYINANPQTALGPNVPANSGLTDISDREYWYVTSNSSNGLRISLSYDRPNFPTEIESPSSEQYYFMNDPIRVSMLTVAGWRSGASWSDRNRNDPPQVNYQTRVITGTGSLSNNEFFTIASRGVGRLPVRLVSFSAQQLDGQVKLKWQSAEEKNTSHFEIERSADGKNFTPILTRKAQGNSASLVSYNALDNSPLNGTSYYRLKMVDLDGTFEYSSLVSVSSEGTVLVRAYPNPSNGREVRFLALNGDKLVLQTVMDAFGKAVGFEAAPVYGEGLYVNFYGSLPAGFYVATLVTDDDKRERVRVKFVVQ